LSTGQYKRAEELATEVRDATRGVTNGFLTRFIITASLYLRNMKEEGITAGMDLFNYVKSVSYDHVINWNFRGLKSLIEKIKVSKKIREVLLLFIKLSETYPVTDTRGELKLKIKLEIISRGKSWMKIQLK
jgi:hypothetical protein